MSVLQWSLFLVLLFGI